MTARRMDSAFNRPILFSFGHVCFEFWGISENSLFLFASSLPRVVEFFTFSESWLGAIRESPPHKPCGENEYYGNSFLQMKKVNF